MICGSRINEANLAMTNGGGCEGVRGVNTCRANDGMKVRDDDAVEWEGVIVGGEEKA